MLYLLISNSNSGAVFRFSVEGFEGGLMEI